MPKLHSGRPPCGVEAGIRDNFGNWLASVEPDGRCADGATDSRNCAVFDGQGGFLDSHPAGTLALKSAAT
jgi:hypothetical protein